MLGRANLIPPIIPRSSTIATLSYTSGTTGNPKGVVLTHGNMATSVVTNAYGSTMPERGCVTASYLPLSHVYARFVDLVAVYIRGCVAYSTGDTTRLLADLAIMRPHTFCSVPRVLNRIYAAIMAQANSGGLKANLLKHAINTKIANFRATGVYTHPVYDRIVFSKLQALLGGRITFMSSGSAPISPDVFETLKVCFCVEFIEGYGLTESVSLPPLVFALYVAWLLTVRSSFLRCRSEPDPRGTSPTLERLERLELLRASPIPSSRLIPAPSFLTDLSILSHSGRATNTSSSTSPRWAYVPFPLSLSHLWPRLFTHSPLSFWLLVLSSTPPTTPPPPAENCA